MTQNTPLANESAVISNPGGFDNGWTEAQLDEYWAAQKVDVLTNALRASSTVDSSGNISHSALDVAASDASLQAAALKDSSVTAALHSLAFVGSGNSAPTAGHITTDVSGGFAKLTGADDGSTDIPAGGSGGPPPGSGDGNSSTEPVGRNFNPNHAADDTDPGGQLPVSKTPILQTIGITTPPATTNSPPATNTPPATTATPPATGTDPLSTIAALIAAQYANADGGNSGGGVVAIPTGVDTTAVAPTTTPPSFAGIAVIVLIIGIIYFAYKHFHKHK